MPCYLTVLTSVVFRVDSKDRLISVLNELSKTYSRLRIYKQTDKYIETFALRFYLDSNKVEYDPAYTDQFNLVKREYALATIQQVARKRKFAVKGLVRKQNTISLQVKKF